jgi:hypothetical protein
MRSCCQVFMSKFVRTRSHVAEKTKNLGIRATPERQRALKHLAADLGLSVQGLVDAALDTFEKSIAASGNPPIPHSDNPETPISDKGPDLGKLPRTFRLQGDQTALESHKNASRPVPPAPPQDDSRFEDPRIRKIEEQLRGLAAAFEELRAANTGGGRRKQAGGRRDRGSAKGRGEDH